MITPTITSAMPSDETAVIGVVTLAFSTDPVARWAYPHPLQYLAHFPDLVRVFGGQAFTHRSAYCVEGYVGAALWLPPDVHPDPDELLPLLQHTVAERELGDLLAVFGQMQSYHPQEPHWYLPLIGVDPTHQGQGFGSALMQHALLACDREHTLAYLESSNPRNIPLYQRHRFAVLGTIQAGASPPLFPMLRTPR